MRIYVLGALAGGLLAAGCGSTTPASGSSSSSSVTAASTAAASTAAGSSAGSSGGSSSHGSSSGGATVGSASTSASAASAAASSSGGAFGGVTASGSSGTSGSSSSSGPTASGTAGTATATATAGTTGGGTATGTAGTTGGTGTTGAGAGQICSSCAQDADCLSNHCNLSFGAPGFCDAAAGLCTVNADCAPAACNGAQGVCDCINTGTTGTSTGSTGGTTGGTTGGPGYIRVVDTIPDGFAVDFCLRSAARPNAAFAGPLLKNLGETGGLAYAKASYYVAMPADCYDVRVVAPNAPDCSQAFFGLPDFPAAGCSVAGQHTSLVVKGAAFAQAWPLGIAQITDDTGPLAASDSSLRFFNAMDLAGASPADFGLLAGDGGFTALLDAVPYGTATPAAAAVDPNGYLQQAPFTSLIAVRAGGNLLVTAGPVDAIPGAAYSLFGLGLDNSQPARLLVCRDDGTLGVNAGAGLAPCQVLP